MPMASADRAPRWAALRPGDDADQVAAALAAVRERALTNAAADIGQLVGVRSVVAESWQRSRSNGVDPQHAAPAGWDDDRDLDSYRRDHPMAAVRTLVQQLLLPDAADGGLVVAISDERGRLLWVDGHAATRNRAATMNFAAGADWNERAVGTNAPGTAIALDHGVAVFGLEHYNNSALGWSCSAAPVHHPATGAILGVIDITGGPAAAAPEVFALVRATAVATESELRLLQLTDPGRLTAAGASSPTRTLHTLGRHRPVLKVGNDERLLTRRHGEILLVLSEHPQGLSGEQLAVQLDEAELDPVTVRAELSRLRRAVPELGLTSRPYRLGRPLDTDAAELRRLLAAGDTARAARRYAGPVLPTSVAPGVVTLRDTLHTMLRTAVLTAGDRAALAAWTETAHGAADLPAWRSLLAGH
ncbi:helix-turn-helix domain-containing protein [Nakamurella aerolata]|uniref:Transcriptional regulator n=1 Tax=Nakamurella aerolata TaxID=1656892 RepID=A0A849ABF9_9ACTN|nr:helix-turn-helix domain-containing protein [Nakamurella aerolata]NNG36478.1 transcriptional regulator [Nakamurella aerolata]